ncbi:hypothetical protein BDA99DRAFT_564104 [Phascolomyces articulosus]|uniref:Uncharacterized protein n=1 Tax=Phascolomyces articulosus TaxID=60185 RepID=A0AAD5P984_9FUNG|nr:hypothetical protein BDA99DRAFT_564104 [Phascolomyces articulosus]
MGVSNPQVQQSSTKYRVVIAYDFGTTYSGAAYAFTHTTPTEVFDIQNWPDKGGNFYPKVPTLSLYPRRNQQQLTQSYRRSTLSHWGYGAKKVMLKPTTAKQNVPLSQFKLHLDESLHRQSLENELTPVQAVADYLAKLHQHTLEELSRGFADNYHPDTFRYCLTVPAVWSDKAKNSMRLAAIQAGLIMPSDPSDRLTLISEPEAAAIYCEETMADQVKLKDNDRFMVCDAGGGTVDLIVFQVNFTKGSKNGGGMTRNNRELKEVTRGIGESCGSIFLDERYRELLEAKLGAHVMSKVTPREMGTMMDYFIDTIKPEFKEEDDFFTELPRSVKLEDLSKSLRDSDDDGYLDDGQLKLSGQELKKQVFDPVIDKVLSLIEQQYRQIPDGRLDSIFLVGGFGSSKYLYQRVRKEFHGTKANQIICPAERAALAVVRGAAYSGANPRTVVSRISRRTYGIRCFLPFDKNIHPLSKRVVHADGSVQCKDIFSRFITKNDELVVDHCVTNKYYHVCSGGYEVYDIKLYATENDKVPRYLDEPGVKLIATIPITIPKSLNTKKGEHLYHIVRMYFGRTEIRVEVEYTPDLKFEINCDFDAVNNYSS